jgi:hypothetical protein
VNNLSALKIFLQKLRNISGFALTYSEKQTLHCQQLNRQRRLIDIERKAPGNKIAPGTG